MYVCTNRIMATNNWLTASGCSSFKGELWRAKNLQQWVGSLLCHRRFFIKLLWNTDALKLENQDMLRLLSLSPWTWYFSLLVLIQYLEPGVYPGILAPLSNVVFCWLAAIQHDHPIRAQLCRKNQTFLLFHHDIFLASQKFSSSGVVFQ